MKMTREFYASHLANKEVFHSESNDGVLVYSYTSRSGKLAAIGFAGRAQKPAFNYSFATAERRAEYVLQWLNGLAAVKARKAQRAAERKAFQHTLTVGTVLVSSWGWEQTNIDFFEVVAVKGKSVVLRQIAKDYDQTNSAHYLAGHSTPRPGHYIGDPFTKRVVEGNGVHLSSYQWASPAENRPYYESHYA